MIVVPYIDAHLDGFVIQKEQSIVNKYMQDSSYMPMITGLGNAYSCIVNGRVQVIAGVAPISSQISIAWALVGEDCRVHMVAATRAMRWIIDSSPAPRIETTVRRDFKAGHRWLNMLGFNNETPEMGMKNYDEEGQTHDLYARV